jgi:Tfp pilus assembly pilus retraction ATPase PilT
MACEVLTSNERAREWVVSGEDAAALADIIKESGFHGMQTFDQALLKHVVERTVEIGAVLPYVRNTHEMRAKAMAAGIAS